MNKLKFEDILDKHKDSPCVIACHGPSLDQHKHQIQTLQETGEILRLSTNNWYDFFSTPPDYWVLLILNLL